MEPLPIHFFSPLSRNPPSVAVAVDSSATASDPWVGSVSAKAAYSVPAAMAGSQRFFCSSEPHSATDRSASPPWTAIIVATDPSPRLISMLTSPAAMLLIGAKPSTVTPSRSRSSSPRRRSRWTGYSARSQ